MDDQSKDRKQEPETSLARRNAIKRIASGLAGAAMIVFPSKFAIGAYCDAGCGYYRPNYNSYVNYRDYSSTGNSRSYGGGGGSGYGSHYYSQAEPQRYTSAYSSQYSSGYSSRYNSTLAYSSFRYASLS